MSPPAGFPWTSLPRIGPSKLQFVAVPLTQKQANMLVSNWHRHHRPVVGDKFRVGVADSTGIVGAAICGRPVARGLDQQFCIEVLRLVTNGTKNACSFLYSTCSRVAKDLGYMACFTYILSSESGASLLAANWRHVYDTAGGSWDCDSRPRVDKAPTDPKACWAPMWSPDPRSI